MPATRSGVQRNFAATTSEEDDRITNTLLTLNLLYKTHVHPHLPEAIQPVSTTVSSVILSSAPYLSQIIGLFRNVVSSAASLSTGSQDGSALLSVGVLLITLYMGLRIMNYIRRTIFGWVWFAVKLMMLLLVVQAGYFINSYGWETALRNAGWLGGIAWGLVEDVVNSGQNGQQRQPRGTRGRGRSNYGYDEYPHAQGGRGRYG